MTALILMMAAWLSTAAPDDDVRWTPPGEVAAMVLDGPTMKPLRATTVRLTMTDNSRMAFAATTDDKGVAKFEGVPRGTYLLTFERRGYANTHIGPFHVRSETNEVARIPEFVAVLNPLMWVEKLRE